MSSALILDHLRLLRSPRYFSRSQTRVRALAQQRGALSMIRVEHEADGRCCRRQPWPITASHLYGPIVSEIAGTDSTNVGAMMAEHEPSVVAVTRRTRQ